MTAISTAKLTRMLQDAYLDGQKDTIDTIDSTTKEQQAVLNPAAYQFVTGTIVPAMRDNMAQTKREWNIA